MELVGDLGGVGEAGVEDRLVGAGEVEGGVVDGVAPALRRGP